MNEILKLTKMTPKMGGGDLKGLRRGGRAMKAAFFLVAFSSYALYAITWSGDVTVPANADETCYDADLANITSLSIGAGATVRFATSTAPDFLITGSGTIIKEGTATWTMTKSIPDFTGNYEIAEGVVRSGIGNAFGASGASYKVTVRNGATLVFTALTGRLDYRKLHITGDGAAGQNGAVEFPAAQETDGRWRSVILGGDATMYVPKGGLFFIYSELNLNGYRLTITGGGEPTLITPCSLSATGEIYLKGASSASTSIILRSWAHDDPGYAITPSDIPFVLSGYSIVHISSGVKPVQRPLWISGTGNQIKHASNVVSTHGWVTNHANWVGAVVFTNTTGVSDLNLYNSVEVPRYGPCMLCVGGPISGTGCVKTSRWYADGRVAILNEANSYTGGTKFENGSATASTLLGYPGSIPNQDFASVTSDDGCVDLALADDYSRWNLDSALRLLNNAKFLNSSRPRFSSEFTTNGVGPVKLQIADGTVSGGYLGANGTVRFEGVGNETPIDFGWYGGTALLTGPQPILLGKTNLSFPDTDTATNSSVKVVDGADVTVAISNTVYIGQTGSKQARLVVSNAVVKNSEVTKTSFTGDYAGLHPGAIFAGYNTPGILEVFDGAVISNKIVVSGFGENAWSAGAAGAVYQRGGHVVALGASRSGNTSSVGTSQVGKGGYYELNSGILESRGQFVIGGYGYGCFAQYGGHVIISNTLTDAIGTKGRFLSIAACNQGNGTLYIKNGSWDVFANQLEWGWGDSSTIVDFTLDGEGALFDAHDSPIYVACRQNGGIYTFNLNGGVMRCGGIRRYSRTYSSSLYLTNNVLYVNFNGGTFRAGQNNRNLFGYNSDYKDLWATNVAVYAGGATIDTDGKTGSRLDMPVRGAWGKGIKSITLASPISGLSVVNSPRVIITGDGIGATAFAHFDSTNMVVDKIVVTSPGCGYTTATAKIAFWKTNYATLTSDAGEIVLEDNENTGSFTKTGEGDLTLNATNTWGGATVLKGGTLKAGCDWAVPTNSAVVLGGGGVLDLNGKAARISSVEYVAGGGRIINASAAELPAAFTLRTTVEDIVAGRAITLVGDQNLDGVPLMIEGEDFSGLEKGVRYRVLSVSGGTLTGAPAISGATPPPSWTYTMRGNDLTLQYVRGIIFTIR